MSSKTSLKVYLLTILILLISVAGNAKADYIFGTPTNLGVPVNYGSALDGEPSISADGLSLYFVSIRSGGYGEGDIWVTTRATVSDPWGEPENLGQAVNSSAWDGEPSISSDGLSLYFGSKRSGGYGGADLWVTTRASVSDPWGQAVNLGPTINTPFDDVDECISADGLSLYIDSFREGGYGGTDIWVAKRETLSDPWSEPINLGPTINTTGESAPSISADGLVLFFSDFFGPRPGGYGEPDIWMATRASVSDPWGEPKNLGPAINTSGIDAHPNISADGSTLYFTSGRPGSGTSSDVWQVSIEPVVDLNSDGIVDSADMCIIVDNWGTDEPLCDIGPMPLGDGIVDVQDLIVLSEHLFENVNDPTLIAHWALDETEGMTAHNSVNGNDDFVMGNALWQPTGGKVNGAIELDGIDDCIITSSTGPNPAEGPFSVIVWIKGGAPGQAIISQPNGSDWLAVDAEGNLMTELNGSDQSSAPLLSQAYVTDGQWHRIGLVWDGSRRALFADDVKVAEDTEDGQGVFGSGLYIGVGKDYTTGTFFSGLIDEVRIYNRAIHP